MNNKTLERIAFGIISLVLFIVVIWLATGLLKMGDNKVATNPAPITAEDEKKLYDGAETTVVEEIVTVDTEIIADGLREMGTLITEEYYFTQLEKYKKTEKVWIFKSEASTAYSYDGVVTAGIDCNEIGIEKDDENKTITISIPKAGILNVDIDPNSFQMYEEKNGLWSKFNINDYNKSLIEFEEAGKKKALEKGIIEKADESAKKMVESFVNSLIDSDEYTIEYKTK
ncbi:MAG: DUF4230 domain-containing protein [Lachnospiraceae bacterium]|nr:DUF4230 domain-containing protein [Lachnospiraceae bacterium]